MLASKHLSHLNIRIQAIGWAHSCTAPQCPGKQIHIQNQTQSTTTSITREYNQTTVYGMGSVKHTTKPVEAKETVPYKYNRGLAVWAIWVFKPQSLGSTPRKAKRPSTLVTVIYTSSSGTLAVANNIGVWQAEVPRGDVSCGMPVQESTGKGLPKSQCSMPMRCTTGIGSPKSLFQLEFNLHCCRRFTIATSVRSQSLARP